LNYILNIKLTNTMRNIICLFLAVTIFACSYGQGEQLYADGTATDQDGNSFEWINYGTQDWAIETAEVVAYRDGTAIPQVTSSAEWQNLTTGAWCYFDNDPSKEKLYNWYAVAGIHDNEVTTPNKEFAPEGWHVPTDAEWSTLENHLIATGYNYDGTTTEDKIAKSMAATTGWDERTDEGVPGNNSITNNTSGFNAYPVGFRSNNGVFVNQNNDSPNFDGGYAILWSSTPTNTGAFYRDLDGSDIDLDRASINKGNGATVRFVRGASSVGATGILLNGTVSAENHQIKNVADPTEAQDAVTKGFLELQIIDLQNQINEIENNTSELPGFISTESLIAYYPFNGNANDISGNGHHGEVNGALPSNDMYGNTNSSFLFTDNQNIVVPDSETLNIYPLTISLWYNPNNYPEGDTNIFSKYVPTSWNGFQILYGDNTNVSNYETTENNGFGTQSWYARNQSNRVIGYYNSPAFLQSDVSINTWYHYVLVIDSTGGKIYINGQLASSDIWDGTPGVSTNNYLWKIGGSYDGNLWYNGKIDDIGIWNRALSQEEVLSLHNGY
jgi:uncharacterized protein (TIGR02145 family)